MSVVPGFKYDLFVSYAHQNDRPWRWVSEFVQTLRDELLGKSRDFTIWWDPSLRTGENFDLAIANAISDSAVFLSVLSLAYGDSLYCRLEVEEFRRQRHPAFSMNVGTMSRMQGIVIEREFTPDRWVPELRHTSPQPFFDESVPLYSRPQSLSSNDPWIRGLWRVRDSIWAVLSDMRRQREQGAITERTYEVRPSALKGKPTLYLAEVTDDLYRRRQGLMSSVTATGDFDIIPYSEPALPEDRSVDVLSVHLFGPFPGRAHGSGDLPLSRLQLETTIKAKPSRRPIVWLPRDFTLESAETDEHRLFLESLLSNGEVEILRIDFEDLKSELAQRMRPALAAPKKTMRTSKDSPIIHIWHSTENPVDLVPLKKYLTDCDCGISVFDYSATPIEKLQSRLAVCDGLIVPYTPEKRAWAEDVMTEAFRRRRREERPTAYAAVELPPATDEEFNFEHPRVLPVHIQRAGHFSEMSEFLTMLEDADE